MSNRWILNGAKTVHLGNQPVKRICFSVGFGYPYIVWPSKWYINSWRLVTCNTISNNINDWHEVGGGNLVTNQDPTIQQNPTVQQNLMNNLEPNKYYLLLFSVIDPNANETYYNVPAFIYADDYSATMETYNTDYYRLDRIYMYSPLSPDRTSITTVPANVISFKSNIFANPEILIIGVCNLPNDLEPGWLTDGSPQVLTGWNQEDKKYVQRIDFNASLSLQCNKEIKNGIVYVNSGDTFTVYPKYIVSWPTGSDTLLDTSGLSEPSFSGEGGEWLNYVVSENGEINFTVNDNTSSNSTCHMTFTGKYNTGSSLTIAVIPKYLGGAVHINGKHFGNVSSPDTAVTITQDTSISVWRSEDMNPDVTLPTTNNYTVEFLDNDGYVTWDNLNHKIKVIKNGTCSVIVHIEEGIDIRFSLTCAIPTDFDVSLFAYEDAMFTNPLSVTFNSGNTKDRPIDFGSISRSGDMYVEVITTNNIPVTLNSGNSSIPISPAGSNRFYVGYGSGTINVLYNENIIGSFVKNA